MNNPVNGSPNNRGGNALPKSSVIIPRPYQSTGIDEIRDSWKTGNRRVLYVLPTGGGKTITFSVVTRNIAQSGKRVWILVHRIELLRQTYRDVTALGIDCGIVNPQYSPNVHAPVQVAMVQTMKNRQGRYPRPHAIIIDEAHHATAGTWRHILEEQPQAFCLGVTATPIRTDGQGLGINYGGMFHDMIIGPQIYELIEDGYLVEPRVKRPPTQIDLSEVQIKKSGDYDLFKLAEVMDKPTITGDAVDHYRRYADGQPCVVFCVNVAHAKHVAAQFKAAGYRAESVDGTTDDTVRSQILGGLATGAVQVVTSCDIISEGTDIPAISCAILLRPTQSTALYLQQVGRALRPMYAEGFDTKTREGRMAAIKHGPKPNGALILDHVGNVFLHGLPQIHRDWSLAGMGKRKKGKTAEKPPVQCSACYAAFDSKLAACPQCGLERNLPKKPDDAPPKLPLKTVNGELVDAVIDKDAAIMLAKKNDATINKAYRSFVRIAQQKNLPHAWVESKMTELRNKLGIIKPTLEPPLDTTPAKVKYIHLPNELI